MRFIPTRVHAMLDDLVGLLLIAAPYLLGVADRVVWPHLILGLFELGAAPTTRTLPDTVRAPSGVGSLGETPPGDR